MPSLYERLAAGLDDRYRLERELGRGGMATVWLANDLKHHRQVAIKVLHPELSAAIGSERFLAEIRTTAGLQHPHILGLIDSGVVDGPAGQLLYYVMPFVNGETLRARLLREKQLSVPDAVRLAREVASALDYAHRQNVLHRDIKPENILLQDGQALVSDFGIALAMEQAGAPRITQTGMSLGTPAYMSPEQAMAERDIGPRSDIYALGIVTYEMLTGEPPFSGPTAQAIMARALTETPPPLRSRRPTVTPAVDAAVAAALQRLPADRFATAKEFADALDGKGVAPAPATAAARPRRLAVPALLATLLAVAAIAAWSFGSRSAPPARRYEVFTGPFMGDARIAPDGSIIAAAGMGDSTDGVERVWLRRLDQVDPVAVSGLTGSPFFSPDSREVAAIAGDGRILRVGLGGGAPQVIGDSARRSGWWGHDGYIYYTNPQLGLSRRRASGGPVEVISRIDPDSSEVHIRPVLLPSGRGLVFTALRPIAGNAAHEVMALDLTSGRLHALVRGFSPVYGNGQLFFGTVAGELMRAPFDADRLELTGPATVVDRRLRWRDGDANISLSDNGTLIYQQAFGQFTYRTIVVVGLDGATRTIFATASGALLSPRLAPAGDRIAFVSNEVAGDGGDIHVLRLGDSLSTRLSYEGLNTYPAWAPDGQSVAYSSLDSAGRRLFRQGAGGGGRPELLLAGVDNPFEVEFTRDAHMIVRGGNANGSLQNLDLTSYSLDGTSPHPVAVQPSANEASPRLSPDGRWLAYISNQSGRYEVFVRPWPDDGKGSAWQVSANGGAEPVWARDGSAVYYRSGNMLVRAPVRTSPSFSVGKRVNVMSDRGYLSNPFHAQYDVLPGDTAFIFIGNPRVARAPRTVVVENVFGR